MTQRNHTTTTQTDEIRKQNDHADEPRTYTIVARPITSPTTNNLQQAVHPTAKNFAAISQKF
jgi:hypothetical protein